MHPDFVPEGNLCTDQFFHSMLGSRKGKPQSVSYQWATVWAGQVSSLAYGRTSFRAENMAVHPQYSAQTKSCSVDAILAEILVHYKVWSAREVLLYQPQQEEVLQNLHSLCPFEQNSFKLAEDLHLSDQ